MDPVRLNKYLADKGIASRREADTLIEKGAVLVNGKKAVLGQKVTDADTVTVNRKKMREKVYLAYYKGRGVITHSPAEGETDIAQKIQEDYGLSDVYPVGRLDKDSEGLIILTNDGRITTALLAPNSAHEREYVVQVDKKVNNFLVKHLGAGVDIEGYTTKPAAVKKKSDYSLSLTLTEGKKHQIRRMCAALGFQVQSLKRVRIMNIELGKLKPNQYRKIEHKELKDFLRTLQLTK